MLDPSVQKFVKKVVRLKELNDVALAVMAGHPQIRVSHFYRDIATQWASDHIHVTPEILWKMVKVSKAPQ